MPKEKAPYKFLSIIMQNSVIKVKKSIILKHFWKNVKMNKKRLNIDKIENRITFENKTGYYLELLTPETMTWKMQLPGSTKSKITKD